MIEVRGLTCGYDGRDVVHDVSFHVADGEKLCILGENGCGKSTLLKALVGVLDFQGSVTIDGIDVATAPRRDVARSAALLSQMSQTYFSYTVHDAVMLGRYPHRQGGLLSWADRHDEEVVAAALRRCGIADLRDVEISELSGGQLQRVFLARTFAQEPKVIMLDEPTNHLDLKYQARLVRDLNEWADGPGRCVVGVFHDVNLAFSFADTIALMHKGRLIAYSPVREFDLGLLDEVYEMDVRAYMRASLERWM